MDKSLVKFSANELFEETETNLPQKRSFLPSVFISAALPLRDTKRNVFIRKYNNITMKLSGAERVPYGKYGRLLLSILTTHAVQEKNKETQWFNTLPIEKQQDFLNFNKSLNLVKSKKNQSRRI